MENVVEDSKVKREGVGVWWEERSEKIMVDKEETLKWKEKKIEKKIKS